MTRARQRQEARRGLTHPTLEPLVTGETQPAAARARPLCVIMAVAVPARSLLGKPCLVIIAD